MSDPIRTQPTPALPLLLRTAAAALLFLGATAGSAIVYTYENTTSGTIPEVVGNAACITGGLVRTFSVPQIVHGSENRPRPQLEPCAIVVRSEPCWCPRERFPLALTSGFQVALVTPTTTMTSRCRRTRTRQPHHWMMEAQTP